jgi:predicted nuclease of predicted toxin-antitoxin system
LIASSDIRFLADENIAAQTADALRAGGADVVGVADRGLRGHGDGEVLAAAVAEGRAVLTQDMGFGRLAILRGSPCHGLILIRPGDLLPAEVTELLRNFRSSRTNLTPPFVVVLEPGAMRVRSLALP